MFHSFEPERSNGISFTTPYMRIACSYVVRSDSSIRFNDEIDRPGVIVSVIPGSAFDLRLTRMLKFALITRPALDHFAPVRMGKADTAAGLRPMLEKEVYRRSDLRMLPGAFAHVEQSIGIASERTIAVAYLESFVSRIRNSGFISEALRRCGLPPEMAILPGDLGQPLSP